jgi:putative endonuclease
MGALERLLDRQEVTGSIPVRPTKYCAALKILIMYFVYVLYSKAFDRIYIGSSSNVIARLDSHNDPRNKGYTARFRPWCVFHQEKFESKHDALIREKQLKTAKGRGFIRSLIS